MTSSRVPPRAISAASAAAAAALLVPALSAAASPAGAPSPSVPAVARRPAVAPAAAPPCATSGLVVWLDTQGNGAAGSVYYELQLTNLSGRTCSLYGYPGVSAVSLAGRQIGVSAGRNPVPERRVTLRQGKTAVATLRIVQAANYPPSRCGPVTAAGLRVYPPNQRSSKVVPFPFLACSSRAAPVLSVEPVQPAP